MSEVKKVSVQLGDDYLVFETGKIAKQANGAVYAHYAGSAVIATVCCGEAPSQPLDYVPVSVEYNEKYYAAGKIPGGFLKREGKPKDKEILVSRLIDRPMRPLFEKAFSREIQIVPTVISTDQINTPDIIAINAASAAVTISDIPFNGPIAGVRVALVDGQYVINPTFQQIENADLDIVVAGTREGITMVEGGAHEVSEQNMLDAIAAAQPVITKLCAHEPREERQDPHRHGEESQGRFCGLPREARSRVPSALRRTARIGHGRRQAGPVLPPLRVREGRGVVL